MAALGRVQQWFDWAGRAAMNWIWPPQPECILCNGRCTGSVDPLPICPWCLDAVLFPPNLPRCPACSRPRDDVWELCGDCREGHLSIASVTALGLYRSPLSHAIVRLKYYSQPAVARPLARALAAHLLGRWPVPPFGAVIPVPLHPSRLRTRGYNQAQWLAQGIATAINVPLRPRWLRRCRKTISQTRLGRAGRLKNLEGAFAARPHVALTHILLVDDVLTTGATLSAAGESLLAAGARRVDAAVVAVSPFSVW